MSSDRKFSGFTSGLYLQAAFWAVGSSGLGVGSWLRIGMIWYFSENEDDETISGQTSTSSVSQSLPDYPEGEDNDLDDKQTECSLHEYEIMKVTIVISFL